MHWICLCAATLKGGLRKPDNVLQHSSTQTVKHPQNCLQTSGSVPLPAQTDRWEGGDWHITRSRIESHYVEEGHACKRAEDVPCHRTGGC